MRLSTAAAAFGLLLATAAHAQTGSVGQTATPSRPSGPASAQDKAFLRQAIGRANYELELAKLAKKKVAQPIMLKYAQVIIHDHDHLGPSLNRIARQNGVSTKPHLDQQQQATLDRLDGLNPGQFKQAYASEAKRINAQGEREEQREVGSTHSPEIRDFGQRMQRTDARHVQLAETLQQRI